MELNPGFRIIIIDDNPAIHQDFIKILQKDSSTELDTIMTEMFGDKKEGESLPNFEIDVAYQGQEGVNRIKDALDEEKPYSLAFVDIRMPPGWDGIETIKHIWELDKDIQVVICTAYSDYSWEETVAHLGKTDNLLILKKPFDSISVRQLAFALTTKWELTEKTRQFTERLKQEVADRTISLEQSLSLVKSTFESSSNGILVVNNDGKIIDYNQKFTEILQVPEDILQSNVEEKLLNYLQRKSKDSDLFFQKLIRLKKNKDEVSIDILKLENGKIFECYSQPHTLNNTIIGRIFDFRDITRRAKLEDELKYQATHDPLTGLPNRVELLSKLRLAIKKAKENNACLAVLFLDFDRFKLVNDSLSHFTGDHLLQAAANRLNNAIEPQDILARIGGDEFIIVLVDVISQEYLKEKMQKLLNLFQEPFNIGERNVTITVSIGVSFFPQDGETPDMLLRNSDSAMYRAKSLKGNNFQLYSSEMNSQILAELDQEIEMRKAIKNQEFFLCYQPQFDLKEEKIIAVEALIRWQHPEKGVLLPMDFIPLAEKTGLIIPISDWVMRTACLQNKAWQKAGYPPVRIAINISTQEISQQDIVAKVKNILQETGLSPEYLELELTENIILSSHEVVNSVINLKKIGVVIAIDDFGTGFSSLSYLHKIPLDRLKIDSSFIQHIHSASDDEAIIRAVIGLAKNLNLEVLAEGVETVEQLNFLKKHRCADVQGFYFSKPLSKEELEIFLENPKEIRKSLIDENNNNPGV